MSGGAASESILFIGSIIAATAFVGVFAGVLQGFGDTFREQGNVVSDGLQSDMTIINDPENIATSPLVVYIKNTGAIGLFPENTNILVDGVVAQNVTYDVLGEADDTVWPVGTVLEVTVNDIVPGVGDHSLRVVGGTGVDDALPFRV